MKKSTPLFKSNPELFKTYVLSVFTEDEIILVKGLTTEDRILASEIYLKIIINLHTKMNVEIKKSTKILVLGNLRRKVLQFMRSSHQMKKALIPTRQLRLHASLHKTNPEFFKKYVLQSFSNGPSTLKIDDIGMGDRMLKNSILTLFMFEEASKLSAYVNNEKISTAKAKLNQKVASIMESYNRLLSIQNTN